jgi:hypothetical protein
MPLNTRAIVVIDFESDGKDPYKCQPVEFACKVFNPKTLKEYPNGTFHSMMRPLNEDLIDRETLAWHAKLKGKSTDEILETWRAAPHPEDVWKQLSEFLRPYNKNNGGKYAPVAAGYNIINFDMVILERLCQQYKYVKDGKQCFFNNVFYLDLMQILFAWMESADNPSSLSFDALRKFFGMSAMEHHTAIKDVEQEAAVLVRWLQYMRKLYKPEKFEGAFGESTTHDGED